MANRKPRGTPGDKSICLPIVGEIDYATLVEDRDRFRAYLDEQIAQHPELFPVEIAGGYRFHGFVTSVRQGIKTRRIRLHQSNEAYQIRPDFVTPYMSETAEQAGKALYLRQHGVSYEGIAYVLGKDETHWYRVTQSVGRSSIVGSTVKTPAALPPI
ncbi:hypothetical protein [Lyngbya confervoides]|uniref:Uncharacterized protein n=1 Tax=Lyngbya confervoides BDU141951 TaxID=1574623 RepID=A0ABD4SY80_9CYAN|nr:hypothetical protein [Lyngbya confervoides]MCM1981293.1 hypothetical protein [Lyngbya confervoides BDU141951]